MTVCIIDIHKYCCLIAGYFKYDTESTRSFQSGELCAYDFQNVIQVVNTLQNEVPRRVQQLAFSVDIPFRVHHISLL